MGLRGVPDVRQRSSLSQPNTTLIPTPCPKKVTHTSSPLKTTPSSTPAPPAPSKTALTATAAKSTGAHSQHNTMLTSSSGIRNSIGLVTHRSGRTVQTRLQPRFSGCGILSRYFITENSIKKCELNGLKNWYFRNILILQKKNTMHINIDINIDHLLENLKQLPVNEIDKIVAELTESKRKRGSAVKNNFHDFLLDGPVMSDDQYEQFLENRKWISQWRAR
jgi:hypothetical protein